MRIMTYEEKRAEARKPIYREYAKIIWTKTYVLFKTDFEYEISTIARNILSSIEMESKYNISYSIFEVIPLVSFDEKKKFMQAYIDQLSSITSYKFNPLKFIQDNIDSICNGNKLNELISLFKSISDKIGKHLITFIDGANDIGLYHLTNYGHVLSRRTAVKEACKDSCVWKIKCKDNDIWGEKDIVLDDMTFVWPSYSGYSRFIDNYGRWGFLNVMENQRFYLPEYVHSVRDFICKRAAYLDNRNGLYGYIDTRGNIVIEPKYVKAMDFMCIQNQDIAVVQLPFEEEYKLSHDSNRKDICGDDVFMGITVFRGIVTIGLDGKFTSDIQAKYDEQKKMYYDRIKAKEDEEEARRREIENMNYFYDCLNDNSEDEDSIMGAIGGGYGDIYGY